MKLVISGGGARISYLIGIKKYFDENKIKFDQYAGSSSGSIFVVLMACNISNELIISEYSKLVSDNEYFKNYKLDIVRKYLNKLLPENSHIICSNKVRISYSYLDYLYNLIPLIRNKIETKFHSKNHLIETILASCSFPFFINKNLFYKYQNKYVLDGFFSNNTPLIEQNNSKNQIIIKTYYRAMYDLDLFIYKKLSSKMIKSGYNHMKNFINKGETTINFSISNNKYNTKLYSYLFLFMFIYLLIKKI